MRYMHLKYGLMLLPVILLCACGKVNTKPVADDDKAFITQQATTEMTDLQIPGMVVGLWRDGYQPYIKAFGNSERGTMQPNSIFRIGGITQTLTAMAVLKLAEAGSINLDGTLHQYLPTFAHASNITIRQLLTMRSGLGMLQGNIAYANNLAYNPTYAYTHDSIVQLIDSMPLRFTPGSSTEYNEANYYILGRLVENITGQQAEDYIRQSVIEPAYLYHTGFPQYNYLTGTYASGFVDNTDSTFMDVTEQTPELNWTAAGGYGNAQDLYNLMRAVDAGLLLNSTSITEQNNFNQLSNIYGVYYSAGLMQRGDFVGHTGSIAGYNTAMWYLPGEHTYLVVLANKCNPLHSYDRGAEVVAAAILNRMYPGRF